MEPSLILAVPLETVGWEEVRVKAVAKCSLMA